VFEQTRASKRTGRNGIPQTRQGLVVTSRSLPIVCQTYQRRPGPSMGSFPLLPQGVCATAAGVSVKNPRYRRRRIAQVRAWSYSKINDLIRYCRITKMPPHPNHPCSRCQRQFGPDETMFMVRSSRSGIGTGSARRPSASRVRLRYRCRPHSRSLAARGPARTPETAQGEASSASFCIRPSQQFFNQPCSRWR
jgi:hypothetical protein